jgi:hypothetical protein
LRRATVARTAPGRIGRVAEDRRSVVLVFIDLRFKVHISPTDNLEKLVPADQVHEVGEKVYGFIVIEI